MKTLTQINNQPNLGILKDYFSKKDIYLKNPDELHKAIEEILNQYDFLNILEQKLSDNNYLRALSYHSYYHNNGFEKYVLDSFSEFGLKLRLHVWWKDTDIVQNSSIHNHSWDFASKILNGGYEMNTYKISNKKGVSLIEIKFPTQAAKKRSILEKERKVLCTSSIKLKSGCSYALENSVLHSVSKVDANTFSIVLQNQHISKNTTVLNRNFSTKQQSLDVNYLNDFEINNNLKRIIQILKL